MQNVRGQPAGAERVRDRVRARWAEIILNFAEILPKFSGGMVAEFQSTRKHQREQSERDFKRSRLPEGTQLELRRFIFLQVHTIENFDVVNKRLVKLFPETGAESLQYLRQGLDNLSGASFAMVGCIARNREALFPGEAAVIEELPAEVDRILVEVQQVLPSFFVLSFVVNLTENVSTQLLRLYKAKYLGRIMFNHWLPLSVWKSGRSERQPEVLLVDRCEATREVRAAILRNRGVA